jgi:predicted amidohydrolase YtcJ
MLFENGLIWQWAPRDERMENTLLSSWAEPRAFGGYANWFTVDGGRITRIGSGDVPLDVRDQYASTVNLDGQLVLPGLHDSHIHVYHMGEVAHYVDLRGTCSYVDLHERVQRHAAAFPHAKWIVGFGWEQDKLSTCARYPSRFDLDRIVADRPVYLWRACFHIAVVNTRALEIAIETAGLNWATVHAWKNVPGGIVDMDCHGHPTGILREAAVNLAQKCILEECDGTVIVVGDDDLTTQIYLSIYRYRYRSRG